MSRSLVAGLSLLLLGGAGWAVWAGLGDRAELPAVASAPLPVPESADAKFDHRGCPEGFVRIPAGSFRMGREVWEKPGYKDESPVHTVVLTRDICMQQRETDQRAWASLMGSNPSVHSGCGETCPVDSVTWRDAVAFANARSSAESRPLWYEGDRLLGLTCGGYRLPTEAEWEYAGRAGEDRTKVVALPEVAWHKGNARDVPHPTGALQPNAWGLYDMLGNVWEWTNDRYAPYEAAEQVDPTGPLQGAIRVRRGGAWNSFPMIARVGNRGNSLSQTQRSDSTGLRLVVLPRE
jgi:formylglycine-generating enzyme required for sulfatase activity